MNQGSLLSVSRSSASMFKLGEINFLLKGEGRFGKAPQKLHGESPHLKYTIYTKWPYK